MAATARPINPHFLENLYKTEGPRGIAVFVNEGLAQKKFTPDQISLKQLGIAIGAIDKYDEAGSLKRTMSGTISTERVSPIDLVERDHARWMAESAGRASFETNPGLGTNLFQVVTAQLLGSKIIEGYESGVYIGDQLVDTMSVTRRNTKLAGFTALGGPLTVNENHPYEESGFSEKYVTTSESKKGRLLSLTEELLLFDQTSEINRRARMLGEMARQERERVIVRGVVDADSAAGTYVYRPSGTGEALYASDGSNQNWIGVGNTTDAAFNAAIPLVNWTDVEFVRRYRAVAIQDDRIDGTQRPISGINSGLVMLVAESLVGTAGYIVNATEITSSGDTTAAHFASKFGNPIKGFTGSLLSSPYIDEIGGEALNDWYVGNFRRQFMWTEVWPLQTFTQGADSEAAFERDVILRLKVRYYGGLSALDTVYVTKVDGA